MVTTQGYSSMIRMKVAHGYVKVIALCDKEVRNDVRVEVKNTIYIFRKIDANTWLG